MIFFEAFIFVFLIGIVLTFVSYHFAEATNIHDKPDEVRKFHTSPTPTTGGLGIGFSFLAGLTVLVTLKEGTLSPQFANFLWYFMASAVLVFLTGIYDDIFGMSSRPKFLMQGIATSITLLGVHLEYLSTFPGYQEMGWIPTILLFGVLGLWLVGSSNTINLIDGVDALAGSIALTVLFGAAMIGANWGVSETGVIIYPLAAGIMAFLVFNKPPASIFMGDTGSLLIGYTLGVVLMITSFSAPHWMYSFTLILLMTVPLMDTVLSIFRRIKRGINPFESDSNHIHHVLQRYYRSPALTVFTLASLSLVFVITGILLANTSNEVLYLSILAILGVLFVAVMVIYSLKLENKNSIVNNNSSYKNIHLKSSPKVDIKDLEKEPAEGVYANGNDNYAETFQN